MPQDQNILIGRNPVREALLSGQPVNTVWIAAHHHHMNEFRELAEKNGAVMKIVSEQKLAQLANGGVHQGVAASLSCAEYFTLEELLDIPKQKNSLPFFILCDGIEDPHNLGAIIRTAETAGADGIILPKRRSAALTAVVHKSSAGAASWLPVARVANLAAAVDRLKQENIWIYGTDMLGECYTDVSFDGAVALVIGSEGSGMSRIIREKCDFLVSLPMKGKITSLNASVAAGIFMYEVLRQRNIKI